MNTSASSTPAQHAALARMQQFMSNSLVPSISTELLSTADGELNAELGRFLLDMMPVSVCFLAAFGIDSAQRSHTPVTG